MNLLDPYSMQNMMDPNKVMGAMPVAKGPPGLLQRLQNSLMPAPDTGGLLQDSDVSSARGQGLLGIGAGLLANAGPRTASQRVGLMQAISQGLQQGQQSYQGALQGAAGQRANEQQFQTGQQEQQLNGAKLAQQGLAMQQAQKLQVGRAKLMADLGQPNTADPNAMAKWIDSALPRLIQMGDDETVGRLSEIRKSLGQHQQKSLVSKDLGDRVQMVDPVTGAVVTETPKGRTPNQISLGESMTPVAQARAENNIIGRFDAQSKDYTKAHEAWSQVDHVLTRARAGEHSPDDLVQLIDGISRLNNPGAVVRSSTVQLQLDKIGSRLQKLQMWAGQNKSGMWPKDIVEGIGVAAKAIADEHKKQYGDLRQRAIKRGERIGLDYMDDVLPNVWETGDSQDGGDVTGGSSSSGGGVSPRQAGESIDAYMQRTRGQ